MLPLPDYEQVENREQRISRIVEQLRQRNDERLTEWDGTFSWSGSDDDAIED